MMNLCWSEIPYVIVQAHVKLSFPPILYSFIAANFNAKYHLVKKRIDDDRKKFRRNQFVEVLANLTLLKWLF